MKIIAHHDLTRVEIAKYEDAQTLFIKSYSTIELKTQLASEFHFCTLKEAMTLLLYNYTVHMVIRMNCL